MPRVAQTSPCPRAQHAPGHAASLTLSHSWQRLAGKTVPSTQQQSGHSYMWANQSPSTNSKRNQECPSLPPVRKGTTKPPVQKGWGTPSLDINAPANGVGHSIIEAHHQDISYLHQAQHIPEVKMIGYISPSVTWVYNHSSKNTKGMRLDWHDQALLRCTLLSDQLSNPHPRVQLRKRCSSSGWQPAWGTRIACWHG